MAADAGLADPTGISVGGGSDGNFSGALGIPTLDGLGVTGDGAHADHEHAEVATLADRITLVAGLLARLQVALVAEAFAEFEGAAGAEGLGGAVDVELGA